ncbi:MAG: hypothetical protein ACK559_12650 [bacterium]
MGPAVSRHESQAGAGVWLRVHVPGRGKEARQLHARNKAITDSEGRDCDHAQPTGRAVQGGGQAVSTARCSGKNQEEQTEGADDRESDVQRGGLCGQGNPHAGGTAEELPEGGL